MHPCSLLPAPLASSAQTHLVVVFSQCWGPNLLGKCSPLNYTPNPTKPILNLGFRAFLENYRSQLLQRCNSPSHLATWKSRIYSSPFEQCSAGPFIGPTCDNAWLICYCNWGKDWSLREYALYVQMVIAFFMKRSNLGRQPFFKAVLWEFSKGLITWTFGICSSQ